MLPDCRATAQAWGLSPEQRQALVRLLAEKGPGALEAWLRQEERRDPRLRARVEAELERLRREARAEAAAQRERRAEGRRQALAPWEQQLRDQERLEAELRDRLAKARTSTVDPRHLIDLSPVLAMASAKPAPGAASRLRGWLWALWVWLAGLWTRLVRLLSGRRGPPRTVAAGGHQV
ncbi:MAG TPA: hypothetical protein VM241_03985, partial [Candidatus Thermoplasmatota archaeon]|nr:hypothetical protein [Candidatus Thermoplasmatota archaeon]